MALPLSVTRPMAVSVPSGAAVDRRIRPSIGRALPLPRAHLPPKHGATATRLAGALADYNLSSSMRSPRCLRYRVVASGTAGPSGDTQLAGGKAAPDFGAVAKYIGATALQFALIQLALYGVQYVVSSAPVASYEEAPRVVVSLLFAFMSLRSRVFSPLDSSRPKISQEREMRTTEKRPSWMPPPVAFPIVWSGITILRTVSSVLIWEACGCDLLAPPLAWFLLHLCIGDTWNNINNVERRKGTSAVVVLFVLGSVYNAVYQYLEVLPTAGYILAPSAVWLTIATVLIWNIWAINGKESLFPMKATD